ncbi:helix-turn-helix transcriptional regulator [Lactococcus garvieae]|uniref:helix-turn-helix domain-containing protein n=1 Tax=Lactococcus garvieae TaxID=1363 RepID=UPI0030CF741D
MRNNEEIVRILIEEKDRQGLSISELARRVDMAKSAISRYFNYTREFPLNRADDFARVLGISTDYLLGISEEDSNKLENNSPLIEKTIETMKSLEEPRQKLVLDTANSQLKEQKEEEEKKKENLIPLKKKKITDEELWEIVEHGVANDGSEQTDAEKQFFFNLLREHLDNDDEYED